MLALLSFYALPSGGNQKTRWSIDGFSPCCHFLGPDLHFLLVPISARKTVLDFGDSFDADVGPLLVHPGLS